MIISPADDRIPILYLAPWLDIGGSDKGTLDWFRYLDRDRFRASLITTQFSPNRRLDEAALYAEEVWPLAELMHGDEFARFILTFIHTRAIRLVHVMNSRLGFELLPEIASLPDRPRVVVQLHVEESDRTGYVRYVTTRYGNLVDAFSVSSQALSDRLDDFDVPVGKRRLIYTGVDAESEFSPARAEPHESLDPELLHILFPARLVTQKDPLLMLAVARLLRDAGVRFCVHVLGTGEMSDVVHERIAADGLQRQVVMHGEHIDMAPWYASCDLVLLTSEYEGVPYVAYEAMAMATPFVGPDLPGLGELVTPETGVLISPRGDAASYANAIEGLFADAARRAAIGEAARARVLSMFPLRRMGAEHSVLYEELLATPREAQHTLAPALAGHLRPPTSGAFRRRSPRENPLVSIVIPCFNHGRYLTPCLESVANQTYPSLETIVVDNASTDPETLALMAELEREDDVRVLRIANNRGPSPARNAAIEVANGRYVLPLDADNILLPEAVATLVEQLRSAGESVGFIYPNYQFFGNRTDYYEPPSYNLHALLQANYCDTSSLIDREIFDRGYRYPEDIVLGFEDWDLVLTLAEDGIYGEPARAKTLLYRKHGFTRADLVDAASVPFREVVAERHPNLYAPDVRAHLKGEWAPAVTVIALDPIHDESEDAIANLVAAAVPQTCADFELVVRTPREIWPTELGRRLRRIPTALAGSRAQALAQALRVSRGRYALASYGSAAALLADRALIEKVLRVLRVNPRLDALALAEDGEPLPAYGLLDSSGAARAKLAALCWPTSGPHAPPASLEPHAHQPLETLARWLGAHGSVQWRHLPRRDRRAIAAPGGGPTARIGAPQHARERDRAFRDALPDLPDLPAGVANRIRCPNVWTPPQSRLLCRHLHHDSGRYVFTNSQTPPPGCTLQFTLGSVRGLPLPGTKSLLLRDDPKDGFALDLRTKLDAPELLGFVEQAPLPQFDPLQIGRHRETRQRVLISGSEDPFPGTLDDIVSIGYIEPYPIHPRVPPHVGVTYGLTGLVRSVDLRTRRHRYGAGFIPVGVPAGELGALFSEPTGDCEPLFIAEDGWISLNGWSHLNGRPLLRDALRWTGAPLTWKNCGPVAPKFRASARRAYDAGRILAATPDPPIPRPPHPTGYLLRAPTSQTVPLFSGTHPVTGDQLLSTDEREVGDLGYKRVILLGHLIARAPVTGQLGPIRAAAPWASRFGLRVTN